MSPIAALGTFACGTGVFVELRVPKSKAEVQKGSASLSLSLPAGFNSDMVFRTHGQNAQKSWNQAYAMPQPQSVSASASRNILRSLRVSYSPAEDSKRCALHLKFGMF